VSREDRLNSKISAGAVAGAEDLVCSPLRSRSAVPPLTLRSASPEFWPAPLRFPLRSRSAHMLCSQTMHPIDSMFASTQSFRGRRIEWRYFRFDKIQDGGDGHLGYTKMAIISQAVCQSTCCLVLGWGLQLSL